MTYRASGILCHITSLPSRYGIGDLGPSAYGFVDWLAASRQHYWQILPLNPTAGESGNSPYQSISAFAANPLLLSPDLLLRDGLLEEKDLQSCPEFSDHEVEFEEVTVFKERLLQIALERFKQQSRPLAYRRFCNREGHWLDDFALFRTIKEQYDGLPWNRWPDPIRYREPNALMEMKTSMADRIEDEKILQYLFFVQWQRLRAWCRLRNIRIVGDLPIYVQHDSADVWAHPDLFKLDAHGNSVALSGVPPDYFSETGQLWGHPIYQWDRMKERGFDWWIARIERNLQLFETVRIDHFRGLVAYWEVPAGETTAINGEWKAAPVYELMRRLQKRFPFMPFFAEDLGTITADVREVIGVFNLPGMRVLQFGLDGSLPENHLAPHNYIRHCIAYTGTHDNNTSRGWYEAEADEETRSRLAHYAGFRFAPERAHEVMIRLVMGSVADTAIFPVQDIFGLGAEDRMNRPSWAEGNWGWRLNNNLSLESVRKKLAQWTWLYGRS